MIAVGIKVSQLANAVNSALKEYSGMVAEDMKAGANEVADDCAKTLRKTSPKLTGSYRKGWKKKKAFENATGVRYTVYNATDYQLTHLLEKGHAKRSGSRVAAIPHIKPAEETAIVEMEKKAKEACRK